MVVPSRLVFSCFCGHACTVWLVGWLVDDWLVVLAPPPSVSCAGCVLFFVGGRGSIGDRGVGWMDGWQHGHGRRTDSIGRAGGMAGCSWSPVRPQLLWGRLSRWVSSGVGGEQQDTYLVTSQCLPYVHVCTSRSDFARGAACMGKTGGLCSFFPFRAPPSSRISWCAQGFRLDLPPDPLACHRWSGSNRRSDMSVARQGGKRERAREREGGDGKEACRRR
ncbi:hypothetical protein JOL62DRAFT_585051 [Phyllosticta paracitricarpa]|uniref:Uncharacterized protein n=1 Tax=Phyllosticta paracitricarpa TaxID=2016321 RepID=A0ABR1MYB2_9PEZI